MPDELPVEALLAALLARGHSRTRATEVVIEWGITRTAESAAVVLVEGLSDQIAFEILASRCGRSLGDERVAVVAMGGATNIGRFVALFGTQGRNLRLAGLYDCAEEEFVRAALDRATSGHDRSSRGLGALGFFACVGDLEEELIRSLGPARVESIVEAQGERPSLRRMAKEPFHRERTREQHLHRFIGVHSGRKYRYARLLAEAVDLDHIPAPVAGLLRHLENTAWEGRA